MSLELACRFTVAMTLSPECDYRETMARLAGHLLDVPWVRRWHVPTAKVFTSWRRRLGWQVMEEFGSSGTSDGSGPFPSARAVLVTARAARAMLGAAMDACSVGEQTLIARLVAAHPGLFAGRVFVVDRNFLGHELATAILDAGGHLVMRISLPAVPGGWLSDGSRMSGLNAPSRRVADRTAWPRRCSTTSGSPPRRSGRLTRSGGVPRKPPSGRTRPRLSSSAGSGAPAAGRRAGRDSRTPV
jgi:Insertion element 4 transposase N-terminal